MFELANKQTSENRLVDCVTRRPLGVDVCALKLVYVCFPIEKQKKTTISDDTENAYGSIWFGMLQAHTMQRVERMSVNKIVHLSVYRL